MILHKSKLLRLWIRRNGKDIIIKTALNEKISLYFIIHHLGNHFSEIWKINDNCSLKIKFLCELIFLIKL